MGWFISFGLALLVLFIVILVSRGLRRSEKPDDQAGGRALLIAGVAAVFIWMGIHTGLNSVQTVGAGNVGVVYRFGSIVGQVGEGLNLIAPWETSRQASIQVQRANFEKLNAFSEETQDVFITATLNYQVSPDAIQDLYRRVGVNWFDRLVPSRVLQIFKDETVKYESVDIAPAREEIRTAVIRRLRDQLSPYSIDVRDVLIDNIDFQPEFKAAIEAKQIATQDALRAQEVVAQREFEARQQEAEALGDANSVRIRAEGQADANKLLAQSLTPSVIQYQAIQKLIGNLSVAIVPPGTLLDPTKLLGEITGGSTTP